MPRVLHFSAFVISCICMVKKKGVLVEGIGPGVQYRRSKDVLLITKPALSHCGVLDQT